MLLAGCASWDRSSAPLLTSRLSPEWLDKAARIRTKDKAVYYYGKADGRYTAHRQHWLGVIKGDIVVLDRQAALVVPDGTVAFQLTDGRNVPGGVRGPKRNDSLEVKGENWLFTEIAGGVEVSQQQRLGLEFISTPSLFFPSIPGSMMDWLVKRGAKPAHHVFGSFGKKTGGEGPPWSSVFSQTSKKP